MADELTKQRISQELRDIELSTYRFNAFGVVATLAFIGGRLSLAGQVGYGVPVFVVLVLYIAGTIIGLVARFGSVHGEVRDLIDEVRRRHEEMSEEERVSIGVDPPEPVKTYFLIRHHQKLMLGSAMCGIAATLIALKVLWDLA